MAGREKPRSRNAATEDEDSDRQLRAGVRDWVFNVEYKDFRLNIGGRPAFIATVGAPLVFIAVLTSGGGSQNVWPRLSIIMAAMLLYASLAAYWIWTESKKP